MDDPATRYSFARTSSGEDEGYRAADSHPAPLKKKMTLDDAFQHMLLECMSQISLNAEAVRTGRRVEALHQLRIGLRRLQVVFRMFGKSNPALRGLRTRTKALSGRLGPARDLDVFMEQLLDAPALHGSLAFTDLRLLAQASRDRAWEQAQDCVGGREFTIFMDDVAAAADYLPAALRQRKIRPFADAVLTDLLARAGKKARAARSRKEEDYHHLRIALKKLRYAGEFFTPLYKKSEVHAYLRKLKRLQDSLGGLNDVAHLRLTLAALLAENESRGALCFAAGQVQGWHRERGARLGKKSLRRWKKLKRCDAFWG
jgi:triphosphatase